MKKTLIIALSALLIVLSIVCIQYFFTDNSGEITVFISINCNTVNDNYNKLDDSLKDTKYIPVDGVILKKTQVYVKDGATVLDLTKQVAKEMDIQLEYSQSINDAYIQGINYLYEFSCGDLSGWMYSVNGKYAHVGCNDYHLQDGDYVAWHYTCDLGKDLEEVIQ